MNIIDSFYTRTKRILKKKCHVSDAKELVEEIRAKMSKFPVTVQENTILTFMILVEAHPDIDCNTLVKMVQTLPEVTSRALKLEMLTNAVIKTQSSTQDDFMNTLVSVYANLFPQLSIEKFRDKYNQLTQQKDLFNKLMEAVELDSNTSLLNIDTEKFAEILSEIAQEDDILNQLSDVSNE